MYKLSKISKNGSHSDLARCDFPQLYSFIAQNIKNEKTLVEVGCQLGVSCLFMMERLKEFSKDVKFYAVDIFVQQPGKLNIATLFKTEECFKERNDPEGLYYCFMHNITHSFASEKRPDVLRTDSTSAAAFFEDNSVYFCFLDACHDYEKVKEDISAWYKKIEKGGILAGHDYNSKENGYSEDNGVAQAVKEFAQENKINVYIDNTCFIIEKLC